MNATKTAAKYHAEYRSFGLDERTDSIITVDDRGVVRVFSEIPKWCSKNDNAYVYAGIRERFAEFVRGEVIAPGGEIIDMVELFGVEVSPVEHGQLIASHDGTTLTVHDEAEWAKRVEMLSH
jgi:hypothetical protein